jgi:hypothetical protein
MDEDRLDAAREKLGIWSASDGSDAGKNPRWFRLVVDALLNREKVGIFDPILAPHPEKLVSDPCLFFLCLGLPSKSVSLRNPKS